MASLGSSTGWEMVDSATDRFPEFLDDEALNMSDISLPRVPSETSSSQDDGEEKEEGSSGDEYDGDLRQGGGEEASSALWPASDSGTGTGTGVGRSGGGRNDAVSLREIKANGRRRPTVAAVGASSSGGSRRRPSGRVARAAAAGETTSPSVSPVRPRRRARGCPDRNARRSNEGPPPLQSASEASGASSAFSSSEGSDLEDSTAVVGGGGSTVEEEGDGGGTGDGGGGGSGGSSDSGSGMCRSISGRGGRLVPFSLSDIPCVVSETVSEITGAGSAASSPFRLLNDDVSVVPRTRFPAGVSSPGSDIVAAAFSVDREAAGAAGARGRGDWAVGEAEHLEGEALVVVEQDSNDRLRMPPCPTSLAAARRYRTASISGTTSSRGTVAPLMLPAGLAGCSSSSNNSNVGGGDAGGDGGGGNLSNQSASDSTPSSPSDGGLTPSSFVPLGPMLDFEENGGGRGASTMNMSASLAGFAGYKSALLEARRAEAAEDQVEFWQRRACAAEGAKSRLEKTVAEQKRTILALLDQRESPPASSPAPGACARPMAAVTASGGSGDVGCVATTTVERHQQQQQQQQTGAAEDAGAENWSSAAAAGKQAGREKDAAEGEPGAALAAIGGIAFTRFSVGQVAMFFPTPEGNFLAFNVGCPGHFLSKESQALVGKDEHFRTYYVLGRIIEIQSVVCEEDNPFKLPPGQRIKLVYVESITPDLHAAGVVPGK